jgi:hypothetical protein
LAESARLKNPDVIIKYDILSARRKPQPLQISFGVANPACKMAGLCFKWVYNGGMANGSKTAEKQRKMPKGKPFVKGDPRINYKGRPPKDTSLTEALRDIMDRDAQDAAELFGGKTTELGRFFLMLPKGIKLNVILAARNITAEISEPNARRLQEMMNRLEGKVPDKVDLSNTDGTLRPETMRPSEIAERVAAILERKKNA